MANKPKTIISDIRQSSDLPPEIGNKFVTKQLANLLDTTKCNMQLATYDTGVKVLVKFPKVNETDIGGAFRITAPSDGGLDRLAITVVGYKLANQLTFTGGLEAVNLNAYHTIAVYNVKNRSAQRIKQVFDAILTMLVKFAKIADLQEELSELSNKINLKCRY
jgi:hypothetical protein